MKPWEALIPDYWPTYAKETHWYPDVEVFLQPLDLIIAKCQRHTFYHYYADVREQNIRFRFEWIDSPHRCHFTGKEIHFDWSFRDRFASQIISTLIHEMVHAQWYRDHPRIKLRGDDWMAEEIRAAKIQAEAEYFLYDDDTENDITRMPYYYYRLDQAGHLEQVIRQQYWQRIYGVPYPGFPGDVSMMKI